MKQIFLIIIGLSLVLHASLSKSNGVVTDSITRLQWQDNYSDNSNTVKTGDWEEALSYCTNLSLNGGGWRVPNIRELLSIVDYTVIEPSISGVFTRTGVDSFGSSPYWSSTTDSSNFNYALSVDFMFGTQDNPRYKSLDSDVYVRCVRSL